MRDKIGSFMSRTDVRGLPEQVDLELRHARRHGLAGGQGAVPAARGADRGGGGPGKPGRLQGVAFLQAALPARRALRLAAAGGRAAGSDEEVRDGGEPQGALASRRRRSWPGLRARRHAADRRGGPDQLRSSTGCWTTSRRCSHEPPPRARRRLRQAEAGRSGGTSNGCSTPGLLDGARRAARSSATRMLAYGLPDFSTLQRKTPTTSTSSRCALEDTLQRLRAAPRGRRRHRRRRRPCSSARSASGSTPACASTRCPSRSPSTRRFSSGAANFAVKGELSARASCWTYYERELSFLRQLGAEFAEQVPEDRHPPALEPDSARTRTSSG